MFVVPKTTNDIDNLIAKGINIDTQDTLFKQTYLHCLVQNGSSLLDHFLTKGPNLNIKNSDGKTPIYYAKDLPTVLKLLNRGATLMTSDNSGKTPGQYNKIIANDLLKAYTSNKMRA